MISENKKGFLDKQNIERRWKQTGNWHLTPDELVLKTEGDGTALITEPFMLKYMAERNIGVGTVILFSSNQDSSREFFAEVIEANYLASPPLVKIRAFPE